MSSTDDIAAQTAEKADQSVTHERGQELFNQKMEFRLGVLPFQAAEGLKESDALMISRILLTHLSERQVFDLVEVSKERIGAEVSFQLSGYVKQQEAIELGKKMDVQYILSGSCKSREKDVRVTVQLTHTKTGRAVYGKSEEFSKETVARQLRIYANEMAADIENMTIGTRLEEIETLLRLHMWQRAYAKIREYDTLHGATEQLRHLERDLRYELRKHTQERIERLQQNASSDEWIGLVPLFLAYERGGIELIPYLKDTYNRYNIQRKNEWNRKQRKIVTHIKEGSIELARELLDEARQHYSFKKDFRELETRLDKREAAIHYGNAKNFKRAGDYEQSFFYAKQALALHPASDEYSALLAEIEREQEIEKERSRTIQAKRARWKPTRRGNKQISTSIALSFYSDPLMQLYLEGGFPEAEVKYTVFQTILPPLHSTLSGGATLSWGTSTISGASGTLKNSFYYGTIYSGIGASFRFTRLVFALEAMTSIGVIQSSLNFDAIDPNRSGTSTNVTFSPGINGSIRYALGSHLVVGTSLGAAPVYVFGEGILKRFFLRIQSGWAWN
jgi:TolB-like protein